MTILSKKISDSPLARRDFIKHSLLAAGSLAIPPALLSACGNVADPVGEPFVVDPSRPWWLQGNFVGVHDELDAYDLPVRGRIPTELAGLYVRNGSNPKNDLSPHWFLGDGMVHGIRLGGGKALAYHNRFVRTPYYEKGVTFDQAISAGLPPSKFNTTSNVSVIYQGGRIYSSGEVGGAYVIGANDCSTVGTWDFGGQVDNSFTAHAKVDPETGYLHFFGYWFVPPYVTYYVADRNGRVIQKEYIATERATMMHSFAITDREAVFWEGPIVFDLTSAITNPVDAFKWTPEYGARIGILPFGEPGSAIRWVEIDPCFVFHDTNAFRDGDDVVIDVGRLPSAFDGSDTVSDGLERLTRWRVNTAGEELRFSEEIVSWNQWDLPTHDRRFTGRPYRYGWFAEFRDHPDSVDVGGIGMMDYRTGKTRFWEPGLARHGGEPFFVPGGNGEGEGWLLVFVHDHTKDQSVLAILDAMRPDRGPIAEIDMPRRVPFGFHGCWVPS